MSASGLCTPRPGHTNTQQGQAGCPADFPTPQAPAVHPAPCTGDTDSRSTGTWTQGCPRGHRPQRLSSPEQDWRLKLKAGPCPGQVPAWPPHVHVRSHVALELGWRGEGADPVVAVAALHARPQPPHARLLTCVVPTTVLHPPPVVMSTSQMGSGIRATKEGGCLAASECLQPGGT